MSETTLRRYTRARDAQLAFRVETLRPRSPVHCENRTGSRRRAPASSSKRLFELASRSNGTFRGNGPARQPGRLALRARQSNALSDLVRPLVSRQRLDTALDLLRLRLDALPHGAYQPVPSLPVRTASRAQGCRSRWEAILPVIREAEVRSAMDIGANAGFFSIELGSLGVPTIAIESDPPSYRTTLLAVRRSGLRNVGVLVLGVRPDTVALLPQTDCTLCLSIWHHFVRGYGFEAATDLLREIWAGTRRVLFFDSGEDATDASFGLPAMEPSPGDWLSRYLAETCVDSEVRHLGRHAAFNTNGQPEPRNLFAVVRSD